MTPRENWIQVRRLVLSFVAVMDKYYAMQEQTTISEVADSTMTAVPEMIQTPTTE